MSTEKNIRIKQKADTLANWAENNPVLLDSEIGLITDGTGFKVGQNRKKWNDLDWYYYPGDAYIEWGGKNTTYALKPIDATLNSEHCANRLNFYPPNLITVESSYDGGVTWTQNNISDAEKIQLYSDVDWKGNSSSYAIGSDVNHQLRITINSPNNYLYGIIRKIHFRVQAKNAIYVQIESDKNGDYDVISNWVGLTGQTGWNVINLNELFGNASNGTNLRLTFKIYTFRPNTSTSYLLKMFMYTSNYWGSNPDVMSNYGRPYSIQPSKKVEFKDYTLTTKKNKAIFDAGIETKGIVLPESAGGIILNNNPITTSGKGTFGEVETNGELNMNNNKITNLATPIDNSDAVNKEALDEVENKILWEKAGNDSIKPMIRNDYKVRTSMSCIPPASYDSGQTTFYISYNASTDSIVIKQGDSVEVTADGYTASGTVISTAIADNGNLTITTNIGAGPYLSSSAEAILTCSSGIIQGNIINTLSTVKGLTKLEIGDSLTEDEIEPGPSSAASPIFSIKDSDGKVHLTVPNQQTTSLWGFTTIDNLRVKGSFMGPDWDTALNYINIRSNCDHDGNTISMGQSNTEIYPGSFVIGHYNNLNFKEAPLIYGRDNTCLLNNTTLIGRNLAKVEYDGSDNANYSMVIGQYNDTTKSDAVFEVGTGADDDNRHTALYIDSSHQTHLEVPTEPDSSLSAVNRSYVDKLTGEKEDEPVYLAVPVEEMAENIPTGDEYFLASLPERFYNTTILISCVEKYDTYRSLSAAWIQPQGGSSDWLVFSSDLINNSNINLLQFSAIQNDQTHEKKLYVKYTSSPQGVSYKNLIIKVQPVHNRPSEDGQLSPKIDLSALSIIAPETETQYTRENCIFFFKWSSEYNSSECGIQDTELVLSEGQSVKAIFLKSDNTIYTTKIYDSSNYTINVTSKNIQSVYLFAITDTLNHLEQIYPSVGMLLKSPKHASPIGKVHTPSGYLTSQHWDDSTWIDFPSQS